MVTAPNGPDPLVEILAKLEDHDKRAKRNPAYSVLGAVVSALLSYAAITGKLEAKLDALEIQLTSTSDRLAKHVDYHAIGNFDRRRENE